MTELSMEGFDLRIAGTEKKIIDMTDALKVVNRKTDQLKERTDDIQQWRDPDGTQHKIDQCIDLQCELIDKITEVECKLKNISAGKNSIDILTDEQIKTAYITSGTTQKQVCEKFKIEISQASNYCNARITDLLTRHQLYHFFLEIGAINNIKE